MLHRFIFGFLGLCLPALSQAALYDRGNGMLYDDVLDITWLQDANYAWTSGATADGRMHWEEARNWTENLEYGGYQDWRLPSTRGKTDGGENFYEVYSDGTELGHMYRHNLGWEFGVWHDGQHTPEFLDAASGTRKNLVNYGPYGYWYQEAYDNTASWGFAPSIGISNLPNSMIGRYAAWAVRDGDVQVAPVPLPGAIWLLISAIVGGRLLASRASTAAAR